jgi:hypothetical protein
MSCAASCFVHTRLITLCYINTVLRYILCIDSWLVIRPVPVKCGALQQQLPQQADNGFNDSSDSDEVSTLVLKGTYTMQYAVCMHFTSTCAL